MAKTYDSIASQTLSSNAATMSFTSIPNTYTDLILVVVTGASQNASGHGGLRFRINNDSNVKYNFVQMELGSSALGDKDSLDGSGIIGATMSASQPITTSLNNFYVANFMSYSNTSVFKNVLGTSGSGIQRVGRSITTCSSYNAINSIQIFIGYLPFPNMLAGTTASLYGVKNA